MKFYLGVLWGLAAVSLSAAEPEDKWEKEIAAFEAQDRTSPPPQGGIVFVGSSSFRLWDIPQAFPDLPVINRGFGGSEMADSVRFAERIVLPYKPKTVVVYAGDNDLANGKKPQEVEADFRVLFRVIQAKLPETRVIYVPVKPSPSRAKLFPVQKETNGRIQNFIATDKRLVYVDIVTPMLDAEGNARPELFKPDMLHLNDAGYAIWKKRLDPLLKP